MAESAHSAGRCPDSTPNIVTNLPIIATPAGAWADALEIYEAKRAAEAAYDRAVWRPAHRRAEAGGPGIAPQIEDAIERLCDETMAAEEALFLTPAPTLAALVWKMDYGHKRWADAGEWPEDWWNAAMADLRRLAARGH